MLKKADKQYKFVLVGDSAVGKSSLINRFVDKTFNESLMSTIGVDFKFKKVKIDNNQIKLQIWDTAGQQTFRSIVSAYYSSADAIVIVYDITAYQSFENVKQYWIKEAQNNNKNNAKIFLIGNKNDQQSKRQVQKFSIETFIQQNNIQALYQASAKTGQKVEQSFIQIAKNLHYGIKKPKETIKKQNNSNNNRLSSVQKINNSMNENNKIQINDQRNQRTSQIDQEQQNKYQRKQDQQNRKPYDNKIKLNDQANHRPKNPNYNKSCCIK